jgi:fatty acid/phospholipid biosynthesis enzyme
MGTGAGKSKATGHKASNTNEPLASGKNQLARNRLHRSKKPKRSKIQAVPAPIKVPKLFKHQSKFEGTRAGRKSCIDSMASAKREPMAKVKITAGHWGALRCSAKATTKPKGA